MTAGDSPASPASADATGGVDRGVMSVRRRSPVVRVWTRKVHNYLGLSLLLFLWLFSVSGLLLNHPGWSFAQFWTVRRETTTQRPVRAPVASGDIAIATELMGQLAIVGEIGETKHAPAGERFEVQVVKPGRVFRVRAQLDSGRATVTETRLNGWGVLDALHKFTGVKMDDPTRTRDWVLTRVWSLAMDALSVGLLILVASGLYLWYRIIDKRRSGLVAIAVGVGSCAFFLYGLGVV